MSLSNRIRPGEPLDADEVEQNFQDLDTLISAMDEEQIERGAINTRHAESANDWKTLETKTEAAGVPLGVAQVLVPLVPSNFTTYTGEAYLVRGMVTAQSTGVNPRVILQIRIGGVTVITRRRDMPQGTISFPIAWLAVAGAGTTQVELWGAGVNCTASLSQLTVLAVRR